MRINPVKLYAVISGDFIGFSRLSVTDRQKMYFVVKNGGKKVSTAFPGIMPYEPDMFRGDGWQILLTDPVMSLRAALHFKAYIRAKTCGKNINTRMAIAVGTVDYVPENRVSAGDGQAFRLSGRLLDKMSRSKAGSMRFTMEDKKSSLLLDGIVRQIGPIADQWTEKQPLSILGALRGMSQQRISKMDKCGISPQATDRYLHRAEWLAIRHTLTVFEEKISIMVGRR